MHSLKWIIILLLTGILSVASSCARFDGLLQRSENSGSFLKDIETRTESALGQDERIGLEQCISIALENNHKVRSADLAARIARLDRRGAFANFLPVVNMNYTSTELNRTPSSSMLGPFSVKVQDRIVREAAVQAQMPVFAPATWFLYEAYKRGEEIGEIAAEYTRQMIALQVTGLFLHCLVLEESQKALESQKAAAEALAKEVAAYFTEGLLMESQMLQARTLVLARETDCLKNSNALVEAEGDLLSAMGLSPMAMIQAEADFAINPPEGGLEDWILRGLLNSPRLSIADRQVAIEEEKLKISITEFLPVLAIFAGRSHTTNSMMTFPYMTAFGFSGLMTLFNGFANINEYMEARENKQKAYISREEESLAIMTETQRAFLNLEDAKLDCSLADTALVAAAASLREAEACMREGLLNTSEVFEAVAKHDMATAHAANAKFQEQLAIAVLRNVIGDTFRGKETKEVNEDEQ